MDGRYTIGTNNRYAMFLGEEEGTADPQDIRKLVEAEKAKKALRPVLIVPKESKVNNKETKDVAVLKNSKNQPQNDDKDNSAFNDMEKVKNRRNRDEKPSIDTKARNGENPGPKRDNQPRGPGRNDGGEGENRGPRRERREFNHDVERPARRERREYNDAETEGRADRRGPVTGGKPRQRQTSPNNRRKREFERKSGSDKTGVKSVDKREGGGAHNWGTHKDDLAAPPVNSSDVLSGDENETETKPDVENDTENKEATESAEVADEVKELTLDEYRAMRGKRQQPQFNLRRAGEGEDPTQWKGLVEMKKKKETEGSDEDEELENIDFPQRVGRQKHVLDIDITFKDGRRGGRVGRGGVRDATRKSFGGQRRNEDRFAEGKDGAPRVDDEKAFPSLG